AVKAAMQEAKSHSAVIKLADCQFALKSDEGPEGVAGTFRYGEVVAVRIHLQVGPGETQLVPPFRQLSRDGCAHHSHLANDRITGGEDGRLVDGRIVGRAEMGVGHDMEESPPSLAVEREFHDVPVWIDRGK